MASSVFTRRSRDSSIGCRSHHLGRRPCISLRPFGRLTELNLGRDVQLLSPVIAWRSSSLDTPPTIIL
ncbi:hypothetical protein SISSUDRAFT_1050463 [Sistotremastrum suecicum HHB10207 ss-3]|uniref:Uncharacterized protein n=1 Tax=Sistotremastrum suecicum HHB10207 ss-3 TaxID=1314776 RepID=A0A166B5K8_9AGAM|nr:hypothetical protein SISSUDRAFT_1050463 [Sistotremastrum suecicum HHB10207 ss-3]